MWSRAFKKNIYLSEAIVILFLAISGAIYSLSNLTNITPLDLYGDRVRQALLLYGVGLFLSLFVLRLKDLKRRSGIRWSETWKRYVMQYLHRASLFQDLRLLHVICVMFVVFIHLKNAIRTINPILYDQLLLSQEKFLFSGDLSFRVLYSIFGSMTASFFSSCYMAFYPYVALLIYLIILNRNEAQKNRFVTSFVLLWFVGILMVYLFPTLGPCFYQPFVYADLPHTEVTTIQQQLWNQKLSIDSGQGGVYLISGFPSLHLAVVILGSVYLSKIHPFLGACSWIFSLLTVISTLYFGWHYVIDDLGSVILVLLVMKLTEKLQKIFYESTI